MTILAGKLVIALFAFIFILALSPYPHEAQEFFAPFAALLVAISFFSIQVKRCHDIGWTGWLALLSFVPVVRWFWWCLLGLVTDKNIEKAKSSGAEFGKSTQEYLAKKEEERKEYLARKDEERKAKEELPKRRKEAEDY